MRVTDFGIARIWNPDNSKETSGTPGYMAPEVMCRQNHGVAVDYFAVGVIGYECMMGRVRTLEIYFNFVNRDLMLVKQEKKLGIIFWPNKFKLKGMKFLLDGALKVLILLTD